MIRPSILIGLGAPGRDISQAVYSDFVTEKPSLAPFLSHYDIGVASANAGGDGSPQGDLDETWEPGVWQKNYERLLDAEGALRLDIERQMLKVLRQDAGVVRGTGTHHAVIDIFVVAPLADPVGSAAIAPVLAAITHIFRYGELIDMPHCMHLLLLTPELQQLKDEIKPLAKARAYAALQELEYLIEPHDGQPARASIDFAWMLTGRSAANRVVSSYNDLIPSISRFVSMRVTGEILADQSFGVALQRRADDRKTRYASLGLVRLLFERDRILAAASAEVRYRALESMSLFHAATAEASATHADTSSFIRELGMDRIDSLMRKQSDGQEIWRPLVLPVPKGKQRDLLKGDFLGDLAQAEETYENQGAVMQQAVSERYRALEKEQRSRILSRVHTFLDDRQTPGSGFLAHAWLSALAGLPSDYLEGDTGTFPVTLQTIGDGVRVFFDQQFEPILFGTDPDTPIEEYWRRQRQPSVGARRSLERFQADLATKRGVLDRTVAEFSALLKRKAEQELAADAVLPAEEGPLVAEGDEIEGQSRRKTVRGQDQDSLQQKIERLEKNTRVLEEEIAELADLIDLAQHRVDTLDRVIEDASERRRLLSAIEANYDDDVLEQRERYATTLNQYKTTCSEVERLEKERQHWLTIRVASAFGIGIIIALGLVWGITQRKAVAGSIWSAPWIWTAYFALMGSYIVVTGLAIWLIYTFVKSREYRDAVARKRQLETQLVQLRAELLAMVNTLAHTRFEHHLYGMLVEWRADTVRYVETLRKNLVHFRSELECQKEAAAAGRTLPTPTYGPFTEVVEPREGIGSIVDQHAEALEGEIKDLWHPRPVSVTFEEHRQKGTTTALADAIGAITIRVFADLKEKKLHAFARDLYPAEDDYDAWLQDAYARAAPFAAHASAVAADALFIAAIQQDDEIKRMLKHLAPNYEPAPNDTEAAFIRLAIGLAAFQFDAVTHCRYAWAERPPEERAGLYVAPHWIPRLQPLEPTTQTLGHADDRMRRAGCLALAYGLAEWAPRDNAEPAVRFDGHLHASYRDWIEHLRSLKGEPLLVGLEQRIEALRAQRDQNMLTSLGAYLQSGSVLLDSVDKDIVEHEMAFFSFA